MTKRIDASSARLAAKFAAQKTAEIQVQAKAKEKLINKIWSRQLRDVLCAAADGKSSAIFLKSLVKGGQLERLGFSISESITKVDEKKLLKIKCTEHLLDAVLAINIENFLSLSKNSFEDEEFFKKYMRKLIDSFYVRAKRIKDNSNDFALVNFLNSETYTDLGRDGVWNDFSVPLVRVNRVINMLVTGAGLSLDHGDVRREIFSLMPSSSIPRVGIKMDILEAKSEHDFFTVSWNSPCNSKETTSSIFSASRMAWLSSEQGQNLMNYVFGRIERSVILGGQSVDFQCRIRDANWMLVGYAVVKEITLAHLEEVLDAKGYRVKKSGSEMGSFSVDW